MDDIIRKILILHRGLLGDTVVALPALWAIRNRYPNARITLVGHRIVDQHSVLSSDVLTGVGVVDKIYHYNYFSSRIRTLVSIIMLIMRIGFKWDIGISLHPCTVPSKQLKRHRFIFKLLNVKNILVPEGSKSPVVRDNDGKVVKTKHFTDMLFDILIPLGVIEKDISWDLNLDKELVERVDSWLKKHRLIEGEMIALGPGSNMEAKRWPEDRYVNVIATLRKSFNIYPIVFGGDDDKELGTRIVESIGTGLVAAGELTVRETAELMRRCRLYLGNDTGTMHLAAAVGLKCVALFSSRDNPGKWEPYGEGHCILRKQVPCEGCLLAECREFNNLCLRSISVDEVVERVVHQLKNTNVLL